MPPCNNLPSQRDCSAFPSNCSWVSTASYCNTNGVAVPCSVYGSSVTCPNSTCVWDIYAEYCRVPSAVPTCGQYYQEIVCDQFPDRCHYDIYAMQCLNLTTTVPCSQFTYSPTTCNANPACQFNTSSSTCISCPVSGSCGSTPTPCSQLNSTTCVANSDRCMVGNGTCSNNTCSFVQNRFDCISLSNCQWSVAGQYCLEAGEAVTCSKISDSFSCAFVNCTYDPYAYVCHTSNTTLQCTQYFTAAGCSFAGPRCQFDTTAGYNGYCKANGTNTPCFAYGSNQTSCSANSPRCSWSIYGCQPTPSTTTTTTSTTTSTTTTTPFVDGCLTNPCDPRTTCVTGSISGNYTCTPCPLGFTGSPYVQCIQIDTCASNPCQPPRNCTGNMNPNLPNYFQCTPCPLGYVEVNSTACQCMFFDWYVVR